MAKDIKINPAYAPGKGVAEALKHGASLAFSDTIHPSSDSSPYVMFNIPHNTFIADLIIETGTSYNGSYIIAGFSGDSDALIADTIVANAGTHSMKNGLNSATYRGGYNASSDQKIYVAYDGSTGTIKGYIVYYGYSNENYVHP